MSVSHSHAEHLNRDIKHFPNVHPISPDMKILHKGVSRLIMLDRYAYKDIEKKTLKEGDLVVLTIKDNPEFPSRGLGKIKHINHSNHEAFIELDEEFRERLPDEEQDLTIITRSLDLIEKPLEIYWEQIAKRVATGLSQIEHTEHRRRKAYQNHYEVIVEHDHIPAGRILYGAGSGALVTYFNCFVLPFIKDSRKGLADHRGKVMEIMSRSGGCGTNGSTLRPRYTLARGVNGKSSGANSWLDDLSKLTILVEQGGSRRGAQMIMLAVWHPDIAEFVISKMQNPKVLLFIAENIKDPRIKKLAKEKLKFVPLTETEKQQLEGYCNYYDLADSPKDNPAYQDAVQKLKDGGIWSVHNPEFMSGANISVCITDEFMTAVENKTTFDLKFPDVTSYSPEEMEYYNEHWHECGDVREWEAQGHGVRIYHTVDAQELWDLICICATYSAEPGIFFIDNANKMTNAIAYGQKVVSTNPCGEQPLPGDAVCNLGAINLANHVDKKIKSADFMKLKRTVRKAMRLQDSVIDATPYFLEENKKQALGERRVGLGIMGLHDLLIHCELTYGSPEANLLVDKIMETIATTAYEESIQMAIEKGSFPFLIGKTKEETMLLRHKFINTGYMKMMPEYIRQQILKHGVRNSHCLTVAPTGTTGTMVGGSTGLEPYYAWLMYRSGRLGQSIPVIQDIAVQWLEEKGYIVTEENIDEMIKLLPPWFVTAMDLTPEQHVDTQCIIQRWVDSSLSKTVNAPKGYSVRQVQTVYERLYRGGAKGGTVYVDGSRNAQVLSLTKGDSETTYFDGELSEMFTQEYEQIDTTIYGVEVGDRCPICHDGIVIEMGGCNTCTHCGSQLKCGL
jgi:ribonucleoside-diphosphate reductase alpha chain